MIQRAGFLVVTSNVACSADVAENICRRRHFHFCFKIMHAYPFVGNARDKTFQLLLLIALVCELFLMYN